MLAQNLLLMPYSSLSLGRALTVLLVAGLSSPFALADSLLWGGRPEFGVELEQERVAATKATANSITLTPSLVFANRGVDRIDLLITGEREHASDGSTANATNIGIRVKKAMELHDEWGFYVRAFVGYSFKPDEHQAYGYSDAAITYERGVLGFMAGVRVQRNLDGGDNHNVNKIRLGPSIELGQHHELEFRWERAWSARHNTLESDSANVEYTYKF
jgi:hypothetical protein